MRRQNSFPPDEYRLGDFLGGMRIAGFAQGGRINQVHVARNQGGKRIVGPLVGILPQQIRVRRVVHPFISYRHQPKVPTNFKSIQRPDVLTRLEPLGKR
jgi:hypothetical protein